MVAIGEIVSIWILQDHQVQGPREHLKRSASIKHRGIATANHFSLTRHH
jgi:hypothetical protein